MAEVAEVAEVAGVGVIIFSKFINELNGVGPEITRLKYRQSVRRRPRCVLIEKMENRSFPRSE